MSEDLVFQLSGSAPVNYERFVGPFMAPFVDAVIMRARLSSGSSLLDVACGTGLVARAAAWVVGPNGRVVGLDVNAGMLEVARELSRDLRPSIEWREASALDMPFEDGGFDAIVCQQGAQFFPDLERAFTEMYRVAAPGARIVVSFWAGTGHSPYLDASNRAFEEFMGSESVASLKRGLALDPYHVASHCKSAGLEAVTIETIEAEVRLPPMEIFVPGHAGSLPLADAFARLPRNRREQLASGIDETLAPYRQADQTMFVPFVSHIVTGERPGASS